nr:MAG TPA: hypothetical protein [Caudoviricetes sp.]
MSSVGRRAGRRETVALHLLGASGANPRLRTHSSRCGGCTDRAPLFARRSDGQSILPPLIRGIRRPLCIRRHCTTSQKGYHNH